MTKSSQKSLLFWAALPREAAGDLSDAAFYSRMFAEDVHNSLVPYAGARRDDFFTLDLKPKDDRSRLPHLETAIALAFDGSEFGARRAISRAVAEWMRKAVYDLLHFRTVWFELVIDREATETDPPSLRFFQVPGGSARRLAFFFGPMQQVIPKGVVVVGSGVEQKPEARSRRVSLRGADLVEVRLRGPSRRMAKDYSYLRTFGNHRPSNEMLGLGLAQGATRIPFEYSHYSGTERRAVASLGRSAGWRARSLHSGLRTDAYEIELLLRFADFGANLRSILVQGANELLSRAGRRLGFTASIRSTGLLTGSDIRQMREAALVGKVPLEQVITAVYDHSMPPALVNRA